VLEVRGLTLDGAVADVSFAVRPGEILGITGLLGSGRTEIAETIFGVTPATGGQILVDGRPVQIRSIQDAVAAGIGYVPSDRLSQGLFLDQPIARNVMAASLDLHRGRVGLLDRPKVQQTIQRLFTGLRIKAPSTAAPVRSLSGGNQQRVVLARWLARSPRVLILNSPTVGVDVNSKSEILDILRAESATGMGIVIISDDVPELVSVCHRVLVVNAGRVQAELSGDHLTEAHIMKGFDTKGPAE
ncbi:MAG: sugar ABC transporter ATP-binding protein, partial [Dactylosporangium sp.]|nr:sugar ABC transporter ATP-binding protein [Dactylosporangium sp.]